MIHCRGFAERFASIRNAIVFVGIMSDAHRILQVNHRAFSGALSRECGAICRDVMASGLVRPNFILCVAP